MSERLPSFHKPFFPPLFRGMALPEFGDPFSKAIAAAMSNEDPGLIVYSEDASNLNAAITLAPEMPLEKSAGAIFVVLLGFADSLGSLAPPEVAVHFVWPDIIKINGAKCGKLKFQASTKEHSKEPDWLVIGLSVPFIADKDWDPGSSPNETVLMHEGCIDLTPLMLLESWSKHSLVWMNRFLDEGFKPIHRAWCEKCDSIGEPVKYPKTGKFMGLDELGNMILRTDKTTRTLKIMDFQDI
ncbi:MAG: biotin/lipoate--protein ligase family protein [Pseudomonadota bacterium]|nr:biotin/lipoate--protein ligase family protein [Pseudomonadota bacterium]